MQGKTKQKDPKYATPKQRLKTIRTEMETKVTARENESAKGIQISNLLTSFYASRQRDTVANKSQHNINNY